MYNEKSLSNIEKSLLASAISTGFLIGCCISGHFSDRIGRVYIYKRLVYVNAIGVAGMIISRSYWMLLLFSCVLGIGAGGDTSLANTIAIESFPPSQRSRLILISIAWSVGLSFTYSIALLLSLMEFTLFSQWRVILALASVFTL